MKVVGNSRPDWSIRHHVMMGVGRATFSYAAVSGMFHLHNAVFPHAEISCPVFKITATTLSLTALFLPSGPWDAAAAVPCSLAYLSPGLQINTYKSGQKILNLFSGKKNGLEAAEEYFNSWHTVTPIFSLILSSRLGIALAEKFVLPRDR